MIDMRHYEHQDEVTRLTLPPRSLAVLATAGVTSHSADVHPT